MAPYKVILIPPKGDRLDLVVPFDGSRPFSDLTEAVMQRASKYRSLPTSIRLDCLKLCLGSEDGYLVEKDDSVQDIMAASSDVLFIVFLDSPADKAASKDNSSAMTGALQIRVITPTIAQRTPLAHHIPLLQGGQYYKRSTTLREIRHDIAQHLHLPTVPVEEATTTECNCKLAELLVKRGEWEQITCIKHNIMGCGFGSSDVSHVSKCAGCSRELNIHGSAIEDGICHSYILRRTDLPCGHMIHSQCLKSGDDYDCPASCYSISSGSSITKQVIVVSGNAQIEKLELPPKNHSALMARLADRFGSDFTESKRVICKGGLGGGEPYTRLPVVAVCAAGRHRTCLKASDSYDGPSRGKLDVHTIEGPINTQNLDLTLENAALADIAVNGVLTLYVVEWRFDGNGKKVNGLDGMFTAASHWKLPSVQSDRGMAAVLSALRVFAHIIGAKDFDDYRQNEVLRILHSLTCFPPAVRAAHILMDGKTLQSNESAALVQSLAAVAEELIPLNLIGNDMRRCLEGSRLVLGLILHNVRDPETGEQSNNALEAPQTSTPALTYITGYHTVDLRDMMTLEPVTEPVLTEIGLVNKGVFDAFSSSALLKHSPACHFTDCSHEDSVRIRVALLYGGGVPEIPYYVADKLGAALERYAPIKSLSLDLKSMSSDVMFLASLCEETRLIVIAPQDLSNAEAPSLTLDRYGNMAVYTGRAACAEPGHDHAVFHPLTGSETNVDVTIVSQMLEPILQARGKDGTNVFDLFSATYRRKDSLPTEMIVFCVDCSHSMNGTSEFTEGHDEDDPPAPSSANHDLLLDDEDDTVVTLEEIKSWLGQHEAYEDMLHLVHHYRFRPEVVAKQVIGFLRTLTTRELASLTESQRTVSRWATLASSRNTSATQRRMSSLRRTIAGLNIHEQALTDCLVFTAKNPSFTTKACLFTYGEPVPTRPMAEVTQSTIDMDEFCVVPQEYLCPISQVVFEDPVSTSDGFVYDRKAIERWFRIRKTSPLTGLPIQDTSLRHKEVLSNQIKTWVKAGDVVDSLPSTPKRTRQSKGSLRTVIDFVAPTVYFSREVPGSATLLDLHKLAFRGMRGLYAQFSLHMGGVHLPASSENIGQRGIRGSQTITISPNHTASGDGPGVSIAQEELCLVRVYGDNDISKEQFSYWVPLSECTMTSVLFRNWRYYIEYTTRQGPSYDRQAWTSMKDSGDGACSGWPQESWASMFRLMSRLPQTKIQPSEALYERLRKNSDAEKNSHSGEAGETTQYDRHRVLKIQLRHYSSPESVKRAKLQRQKVLSRLAVTKQVFSQFINRMIAYNFPCQVGLVTFGTQTQISQPLTAVIENFRQAVDRMNGQGDTALWDALAVAADHLVEVSRRFPDIRKRIICLSDGEDTTSVKKVEDVCRTLMQHEIVVDSVCIGDEDSLALRKVSYFTGGYKFVPSTIEEASGLCELEPVLSVHERPPVSRPSVSVSHNNFHRSKWSASARPDPVTADEFPARKTHESLDDSFIQIGQIEKAAASATSSVSSIRARRLLQEIRDIANRPHPSYDVYVSESNMGFWKIVLLGSAGSAYAGGAFVLYLDMGDEYPRKAPSGRFITPIFHPNINRHGRICHSIFDRNWTVDTTNKQVLDTVFGLLLVPEFSDPINTVVTFNFYWDQVAFKDEVQKHIQKHASKSRLALGQEILGDSAAA